jgi:hypothetical protein
MERGTRTQLVGITNDYNLRRLAAIQYNHRTEVGRCSYSAPSTQLDLLGLDLSLLLHLDPSLQDVPFNLAPPIGHPIVLLLLAGGKNVEHNLLLRQNLLQLVIIIQGAVLLNPIPHGIFFSWLPRGGVDSDPPYGKSTSECLSPILFYTVTSTYIRSSDPKGFIPSFKTLGLVADQSSAVNSTYASNFRKSKIYKGKSAADFFGGPPKIYHGT